MLSLDLRVLWGTGSQCRFQALCPGCSGLGLGLAHVCSQAPCMGNSDVAGLTFGGYEPLLNREETEAQGRVRTWPSPRVGEWQSRNLSLRFWTPSAVLLTVQHDLLVLLLYLGIF